MITQETITKAKSGNEAALNEIMDSVRYTYLSVIEGNKNGFAQKYQIEDFKAEFPSCVWDAIQKYDEDRGCSFNTFFHNHVYWIIGKQKRKVALGQFETPMTGAFENEETADFVMNNLEYENAATPGVAIDIAYLKKENFNLNEHESFLIEKIFSGSNMKEAMDEFETVYGKSRQWAYVCRDSALKKIQKHATK